MDGDSEQVQLGTSQHGTETAPTYNPEAYVLQDELLLQQTCVNVRVTVLSMLAKKGWSASISLSSKIDAVTHALSCTSPEFQKLLFRNLFEAYARSNQQHFPVSNPISQTSDLSGLSFLNDADGLLKRKNNQSENHHFGPEIDATGNTILINSDNKARNENEEPVLKKLKVEPFRNRLLTPVVSTQNFRKKHVKKPDTDVIMLSDDDTTQTSGGGDNKENKETNELVTEKSVEKSVETEEERDSKMIKDYKMDEKLALKTVETESEKYTNKYLAALIYLERNTRDEAAEKNTKTEFVHLIEKLVDLKHGKKRMRVLRAFLLEIGASENQDRGSDACKSGTIQFKRNQTILFKIASLLGNICRVHERHIQLFVNQGIHADLITVCESEVNEFRVLQCSIWAFRDICHHGRTKIGLLNICSDGTKENITNGPQNLDGKKAEDLKDIMKKPVQDSLLMRLFRVCCRVVEKTKYESDDSLFEEDIYMFLRQIFNSTIIDYENLAIVFKGLKNKLKDASFFKHVMHKCFLHSTNGNGNGPKLELANNANWQRLNVLYQEDKSYVNRYCVLAEDFTLAEKMDSLKFLANLLESCEFKRGQHLPLKKQVYKICMSQIDISDESDTLVESLKLLEYVSTLKPEYVTKHVPQLINLINLTHDDDQVMFFAMECLVEISKWDQFRVYLKYNQIFMKADTILSSRDPTIKPVWAKTMRKTNNLLEVILKLLKNKIEMTEFGKKHVEKSSAINSLRRICLTLQEPKYSENKTTAKKTWDLIQEIKNWDSENQGFDLFPAGGSSRRKNNNTTANREFKLHDDTFTPILKNMRID